MAVAKHPVEDWAAIESEYRAGPLSLRSIALKYGVPRSTIADKAKAEGWKRSPSIVLRPGPGRTKPALPDAEHLSAAAIAQYCLHGLAQLVEQGLSLVDYKVLSDALASFHKILITSSPVQEQRLSYLSPELIGAMSSQEQEIVQKILAAAEQRLAALRDEKITPMRKPV
jgi:hypothetical protein